MNAYGISSEMHERRRSLTTYAKFRQTKNWSEEKPKFSTFQFRNSVYRMVAINWRVNGKSVILSKFLGVVSFDAWEERAYVCACVWRVFEKFALKYLAYELMETLCLARASKPIDQT